MSTVGVGHVGLSQQALPLVVPVVFALRTADIIINGDHDLLDPAAQGNHVVCFNADVIDADAPRRWRVTVAGLLSVMSEFIGDDLRLRLAVPPWELPTGFARLQPSIVTGRDYG